MKTGYFIMLVEEVYDDIGNSGFGCNNVKIGFPYEICVKYVNTCYFECDGTHWVLPFDDGAYRRTGIPTLEDRYKDVPGNDSRFRILDKLESLAVILNLAKDNEDV